MEKWKRGGTKDRDNPRLLTTPGHIFCRQVSASDNK